MAESNINLPKGFVFGVNLGSPYQVEGATPASDFGKAALKNNTPARAKGWWTDRRIFIQDLDLAADLGVSVVRFGTEWARVEPRPGKYDKGALHRYKSWVDQAKDYGLKVMLNLHHFTLPEHVAADEGWLNKQTANRFTEYAKQVMGAVGESVDWVLTTNEPSVLLWNGYYKDIWPPGNNTNKLFKLWDYFSAMDNLALAHNQTRDYIKANYPPVQVGATEAIRGFWPKRNPFEYAEMSLRERWFNTAFFRRTENDFYGANYFRCYSLLLPRLTRNQALSETEVEGLDPEVALAADVFPNAMRRFAKALLKKPIIITENGLDDPDDKFRIPFMTSHLAAISKLIAEGVPITGYLPWCLRDTPEWFKPVGVGRFGLAETNFMDITQTPQPRPSFDFYRNVCAAKLKRTNPGLRLVGT